MRQLVRTVLALGAIAVLVIAVILIFRFQEHPSVITGVTVGPVALGVLSWIIQCWRKGRNGEAEQATTPEQADAAADCLAEETADYWRREAAARRITTPVPALVPWQWGPDALSVSRGEAAVVPSPGTGPAPLPDLRRPGRIRSSGAVTHLYDEVYARLPYGRLVLTGGPGSGKTGTMILLLLAALEWRAGQPDVPSRSSTPVPVWLTLGGWNPEAESLAEWVTDTLNRDYPALRVSRYGADAAGYLVRHGRVALFLDGLDEMPADLRAAVLNRLNTEARKLRVVLTARPTEYQLALHDVNLDYCAVIELCPVRAKAAADYLLQGRTGGSRQLWKPIAGYLKSRPDSVTAKALDNPLTLSMARDAYAARDPAPLIDPTRFPTTEALSGHLIDQFLVTAYPDEHQRAHAIRWLAWIARNMGAGKDLRWWDIPGWVPGWYLRAARGLLAGIATWPVVTLLAWLTYRTATRTGAQGPPGIAAWAAPGIASGLGAAILAGLVINLEGGPVAVRRRSLRQRLRGLLPWVGAVVVSLLAGGVADAVTGGARSSRPTIATAYTEVAVFAVVMLTWGFGRSRRTRPGPLLERPVVRAVTGTLGAVFPATLWAYLVIGPGKVVFAAFIAAVYALVFGAILTRLWRGAHGGRRSGPWTIAPQRPRSAWLAPLWLVVVPLAFPRLVSGWVTMAADVPSATPESTYRTDRRACIVYAGGYAAMLAIPSLLVIAALIVAANHPPVATRAALIIGWAVAAVLIAWSISWLCAGQVPLVLLTQLVLYPSRGRVSFARLLNDARKRQVLRQAGAVYQFRHAVLQSRLANRPEYHVN
jgi:hypothetical protein